MEAYTEFAQVYDRFMDNVPYEAWCEGISKILTEHGISEGLVLDLGCGTGTMTRLLRQKGYDMIGVDASAEMLEIARNHPGVRAVRNCGGGGVRLRFPELSVGGGRSGGGIFPGAQLSGSKRCVHF